MNDKPAILLGLVVFLTLATLPSWYTLGEAALFSADTGKPELPAAAGALEFSTAWAGQAPDLATLRAMFDEHQLAPLSPSAVLTPAESAGKWRLLDGSRRYVIRRNADERTLQVYDGCVDNVEFMRSDHMRLLIEWREGVIRHGDTSTVEVNGKAYPKSLVKTCLGCHTDRQTFCFQCHEYANTLPAWPARNISSGQEGIRCWNCHLQPEEESNDG